MKPLSGGIPMELSAASRKMMREDRHHLHQPAVLGDLARVPPLVDHADDQEEHAGGNAVIDLLDDRAGDARRDSARRFPACRSPGG